MSLLFIPFHLFLLKPQIQSDYFSLIYTHFYFSEDFEECIHEVIRKQVQVIDAKIILHFVFLHSICVACSVSQQNKHFSFCHIWKPAYTIGSGLGAHAKVPQHLRAGHSPRTVTHLLGRLVFFLFCELQSGSWDAAGMLTVVCYGTLDASRSSLGPMEKVFGVIKV